MQVGASEHEVSLEVEVNEGKVAAMLYTGAALWCIQCIFEVGESAGEIFRMLKCEKVCRLFANRNINISKVMGILQDKPRSGLQRTVKTRQLKMKMKKSELQKARSVR